jgi:hypothetical protein
MANETKRIVIRKGLAASTPNLDEAEFGFQTDTGKVVIGTSGANNITLANEGHTHTIADTTGLQAALDTKAASAHAHAIADVTGLQSALDGKTTESFVTTAINNLIASAPGTLDTLNELAAALGDDPNFAATVTATLNLLSIPQDINHYRIACTGNGFSATDNSRFLYYKGRTITINGTTYTGNVFQRTETFAQYDDFTIVHNGSFDYVYNQASVTKVVVGTTIFQPAGTENFETSEAGAHRLTLITQGTDPTTASSTRTLVIEKL